MAGNYCTQLDGCAAPASGCAARPLLRLPVGFAAGVDVGSYGTVDSLLVRFCIGRIGLANWYAIFICPLCATTTSR